MNRMTRIKSLQTRPPIYGNLVYDKGSTQITEMMINVLINSIGTTNSRWKKTKLNHS